MSPASPLTPLPDPAGPKPWPDNMWTFGIAVDGTASVLAQTAASRSGLTTGHQQELYFYTRSGDRWTRQAVPPRVPGQGPPVNVSWSRDGRWLAVSTGNALTAGDSSDYRVYVYRRDGASLTLAGKSPAGGEVLGIGGATTSTAVINPTARYNP